MSPGLYPRRRHQPRQDLLHLRLGQEKFLADKNKRIDTLEDYVPQPPAEYDEAQAQAESQALTIVSAADELAYRMKALHVGKGRVETALFLHKIADIIIAKEFEEVTKSKDYLNITYLGKDEKLHKVAEH